MKARINQSQSGKSLLVTFLEGYSTYTITIPMPYAVRFFAEGARTSLEILEADESIQSKLGAKEGEKSEILENLRKSLTIYDDLMRESLGE
ncbi:MAG: hypothetical protein ACFFER_05650 [Candidatus Thorarchaeota archaeon]